MEGGQHAHEKPLPIEPDRKPSPCTRAARRASSLRCAHTHRPAALVTSTEMPVSHYAALRLPMPMLLRTPASRRDYYNKREFKVTSTLLRPMCAPVAAVRQAGRAPTMPGVQLCKAAVSEDHPVPLYGRRRTRERRASQGTEPKIARIVPLLRFEPEDF
ncbi:hypothetical protein ACP4OV_000103 [Aristida adscensionis]